MQAQDGRQRQHPDQEGQQVQHLREEHSRGDCRQQRHPQTAQRTAGDGQTIQAFRHEEVPAECQQRDEKTVPREEQAGDSGKVNSASS